jgi:hypothetical protein
VRVRTLWKVYLPPTPFLPGARSGHNPKIYEKHKVLLYLSAQTLKNLIRQGGPLWGALSVWSKKLEVENQLIRRLSNKLLFRFEFSRV